MGRAPQQQTQPKLKKCRRLGLLKEPHKAVTEAKCVSINTIIMLNEIIKEYSKVHALK
jgi:hypothetical protein